MLAARRVAPGAHVRFALVLCCMIATFHLISNCDKKWVGTKRGQTSLNAFNSLFLLRQEKISNSRDE